MRLKEDSSRWRSHAVKKRDFKHDHSDSLVNFKSRKNTNKCCKGKLGIQHSIKWQQKIDLFGKNYKIGKCATCGRHMFGRA